MFTLIDKVRKKPLAFRQKVVFLLTILVVMIITVVWFLASLVKYMAPSEEFLNADTEKNAPAEGLIPPYTE